MRFIFSLVCGPSGVGKSTLITRLQQEFPNDFGFSVSHTTRAPRTGEVHGVHYNFTTKESMKEAIDRGEFLEHALVHDNMYGTSFEAIRNVSKDGKICILDIDVQGVASCRHVQFPIDKYIFVSPPAIAELEKRLRGRGTDSEESIQRRLTNAHKELTSASTMWWDAWIVNDDLDRSYQQLRSIITGIMRK
jgi:guanylate kinase